MAIVILIPTVLCILALFRNSVQRAFLNVYIPIFMIFPVYYFWKVPSLPPIDLAEATLFPLGVAICFKELRRWRFAPMDLWVVIFVFTTYYADSLNITLTSTAATFDLFASICLALIPYMAGQAAARIRRHAPRYGQADGLLSLRFLHYCSLRISHGPEPVLDGYVPYLSG